MTRKLKNILNLCWIDLQLQFPLSLPSFSPSFAFCLLQIGFSQEHFGLKYFLFGTNQKEEGKKQKKEEEEKEDEEV